MEGVSSRATYQAPTMADGTMTIYVSGVLGAKNQKNDYEEQTTYKDLQASVDIASRLDSVKKVLFVFDSPGGSVLQLNETIAKIKGLKKPKYGYTETLNCSASYALSCGCDYLYSSPSAIVGSIGAKISHTDISGMLQNMGIKITEIGCGDKKLEMSPYKPLSDEDKDKMKEQIKEAANDFKKLVMKSRPNVNEDVFSATTYDGKKAVKMGLADGVLNTKEDFDKFIAKIK